MYLVGSKSWSQKYDMSVDRMMESDVAKPLRMLSAYLMTAAMTRPPSAWRNNKHRHRWTKAQPVSTHNGLGGGTNSR